MRRFIIILFAFLLPALASAAVVEITSDLGSGYHYYPDDSVYILANQTGSNFVMHARRIVLSPSNSITVTAGGAAGAGGGGGGGGGRDGFDAAGAGGAGGSPGGHAGVTPVLGATSGGGGGAGGAGVGGTNVTLAADEIYDETAKSGGGGRGGNGGKGGDGKSWSGHDEEGGGGGGGGGGGPGGGVVELYAEQGLSILGRIISRGSPGGAGGAGGQASPGQPTRYGGAGGRGGAPGKPGGQGGPACFSQNAGSDGGAGSPGYAGTVVLSCYAGDIIVHGRIDAAYTKVFYGGDFYTTSSSGLDYEYSYYWATNGVVRTSAVPVFVSITNTLTTGADPWTSSFSRVTNTIPYAHPITLYSTLRDLVTTGAVTIVTQYIFDITYQNTYTNATDGQTITNAIETYTVTNSVYDPETGVTTVTTNTYTNSVPFMDLTDSPGATRAFTNYIAFDCWTDWLEVTNYYLVTNATPIIIDYGSISSTVKTIYKRVTNYHPSDRVRENTGGRGSRNIRMREPWF